MKNEIQISPFERAIILEEINRYAFAKMTDNYNFTYLEILGIAFDGEGQKHYRVSPGRPGLQEAFQGSTKTPVPEAEMREKWEKLKAEERLAEEAKIRASIEKAAKEKAAVLRAEKLAEAKALLANSREELKKLILEGKSIGRLADNSRVATLLQRISAAVFIIDTL